MEHANLDALIDRVAVAATVDQLMLRRLKKRRLLLKDEVTRIQAMLSPNETA